MRSLESCGSKWTETTPRTTLISSSSALNVNSGGFLPCGKCFPPCGSYPVWDTLPTLWVTLPTLWVTLPTLWKTLPTLWKTLPTLWKTLPTLRKTLPTLWKTLPTLWETLPTLWKTLPSSRGPSRDRFWESRFGVDLGPKRDPFWAGFGARFGARRRGIFFSRWCPLLRGAEICPLAKILGCNNRDFLPVDIFARRAEVGTGCKKKSAPAGAGTGSKTGPEWIPFGTQISPRT